MLTAKEFMERKKFTEDYYRRAKQNVPTPSIPERSIAPREEEVEQVSERIETTRPEPRRFKPMSPPQGGIVGPIQAADRLDLDLEKRRDTPDALTAPTSGGLTAGIDLPEEIRRYEHPSTATTAGYKSYEPATEPMPWYEYIPKQFGSFAETSLKGLVQMPWSFMQEPISEADAPGAALLHILRGNVFEERDPEDWQGINIWDNVMPAIVGEERAARWKEHIDAQVEGLDPYHEDHSLWTADIQAENLRRQQMMAEIHPTLGVAQAAAQQGADLLAMMVQFGLTRRAIGKLRPGAATLKPTPVNRQQPATQISKQVAERGAIAFARTPGTIEERGEAALTMMAYNMTPHITHALPWGLTGLSAYATDVGLNTWITSSVYLELWQDAQTEDGFDFEFFATHAIPQLTTDMIMSWSVRGLPSNRQIHEIARMKGLPPKEVRKTIKEYEKAGKEMEEAQIRAYTEKQGLSREEAQERVRDDQRKAREFMADLDDGISKFLETRDPVDMHTRMARQTPERPAPEQLLQREAELPHTRDPRAVRAEQMEADARATHRYAPERPEPRPIEIGDKVRYEVDGKEYTVKNVTDKGNVTFEERKGVFQPRKLTRLETPEETAPRETRVVDKKGQPLPVYHGTRQDFQTFQMGDVGFHFGTKGQARTMSGHGKDAKLIEANLDIKNPIVFDKDLENWNADYRLPEELKGMGILTKGEYTAFRSKYPRGKTGKGYDSKANQELRQILSDKGYDGIKYENWREGRSDQPSWIAFDRTQISRTDKTDLPQERVAEPWRVSQKESGLKPEEHARAVKEAFERGEEVPREILESYKKTPWGKKAWEQTREEPPRALPTKEQVTPEIVQRAWADVKENIPKYKDIDLPEDTIRNLPENILGRAQIKRGYVEEARQLMAEGEKEFPPKHKMEKHQYGHNLEKFINAMDKEIREDLDTARSLSDIIGRHWETVKVPETEAFLRGEGVKPDAQIKAEKKEVTVDERRGDSRIHEEHLKKRGLEQGEVGEGRQSLKPTLSQTDRQRFGKVLKDLSKREGREADGKLVEEPTRDQQNLQERMLEHFGVRVLFFERESQFGELGVSDGTRAFVREMKDVDTHWTAGHEIGHVIARSNKTVEKGVKLKDVYKDTLDSLKITDKQAKDYVEKYIDNPAYKEELLKNLDRTRTEIMNDEIGNLLNKTFGRGEYYPTTITDKQWETLIDKFPHLVESTQKAMGIFNRSVVEQAAEREDPIDYTSRVMYNREGEKDTRIYTMEITGGPGMGLKYELEVGKRPKSSLLSEKHDSKSFQRDVERIDKVPKDERRNAYNISMSGKDPSSKLHNQVLVTLSRGCTRLEKLIEAAQAGVISSKELENLQSCHLGCYKNFDTPAKSNASPLSNTRHTGLLNYTRQLLKEPGKYSGDELQIRKDARKVFDEYSQMLIGRKLTDQEILKTKGDSDTAALTRLKSAFYEKDIDGRREIFEWLDSKGFTKEFVPYEGRSPMVVATPDYVKKQISKIPFELTPKEKAEERAAMKKAEETGKAAKGKDKVSWQKIMESPSPFIRGNQDGDFAAEIATGTWQAYADAMIAGMRAYNTYRVEKGLQPLPEKKLVGITSGWYIDVPDKVLRDVADKYGDKLVLHITGPLDFPKEVDLRLNAYKKYSDAGLKPIMRLISDEFNQGGKALNDKDSIAKTMEFLVKNKIDSFQVLETPLHLDDPRLKGTSWEPAAIEAKARVMRESQELSWDDALRLANNITLRNNVYGLVEGDAKVPVGKSQVGLTYDRLKSIGVSEETMQGLRDLGYTSWGKRFDGQKEFVFPLRCCTTGKCQSCSHACMTKTTRTIEQIPAASIAKEGYTVPREITDLTMSRPPTGAEVIAKEAFQEYSARKMTTKQEGTFKESEWFTKLSKNEQKELQKNIDGLKKLMKSKHLRPEYRHSINSLLKGIDWRGRKISDKERERLYKLRDQIEKGAENLQISSRDLSKLRQLGKKPLAEVPFEELRTIFSSVQRLAHENELAQRLVVDEKMRADKEMIQRTVERIPQGRKAAIDIRGNAERLSDVPKGLGGKLKTALREFHNYHLTTENLAWALDRETGGPIGRVFHEEFRAGSGRRMHMENLAEQAMSKALGDTDPRLWSGTLVKKGFETIDTGLKKGQQKIKLTPAEIMSLYLHTYNDHNREAVLKGGFKLPRLSDAGMIKFKEGEEGAKQLQELVDKLTPKQREVADAMLSYLNTTQKDAMNEVSRKLIGDDVAKVENYWSITHPKEVLGKKYEAQLRKFMSRRALEEQGFLQPRKGSKAGIMLHDAFDQFYRSVTDGSRYVGLAVPVRDARTLLSNQDFVQQMEKYGLKRELKHLTKHVDYMEGIVNQKPEVEKFAERALRNVYTSILGLNVSIAVKQPISYTVAATEMDMKYLVKALGTRVKPDTMKKYSPQATQRLRGMVHPEMGEVAQMGETRRFFTGEIGLPQKMTFMIRQMDTNTVGRIWNAVEMEVKDKHPHLKGDEFHNKVARRWEEILDRTQVGGPDFTQSALRKDAGLFTRTFTMFTSQRNKNYNTMHRAYTKFMNSQMTKEDYKDFAKSLFLVGAAQSLLLNVMTDIGQGIYQRDLKDEIIDPVSLVGNVLSNVYGVGPVFDAVSSHVDRGFNRGFDISNPLTDFFMEGVRASADVLTAIDEFIEQAEYTQGAREGQQRWKTTAKRAAFNMGAFAGKAAGIPTQNIRRGGEALIKATYPEAEFAVANFTRNVQNQYYYELVWEHLKRGNKNKAKRYVEILHKYYETTPKRLRTSGQAESYAVDQEQVDEALQILNEVRRGE